MKPQIPVRVDPLENPHSKSSKFEAKGAKKSTEMDDILDKIKEKSRQEIAEAKKRKPHTKKAQAISGDNPSATLGDPEEPTDIVSQTKVFTIN